MLRTPAGGGAVTADPLEIDHDDPDTDVDVEINNDFDEKAAADPELEQLRNEIRNLSAAVTKLGI